MEETKIQIWLWRQEETAELLVEALRWSDPPSRRSFCLS